MATIDQILRQAANPFDPATFKPGNFWQENPAVNPTVDTIHQEALGAIATLLGQVNDDHKTRTLLLLGDSGSGKSHLLGRLKQTLNAKAFFVYIGPWADSTYIWRHILRQTVDSLIQVPEGQQESQLLLWLKSLSIFQKKTLMDRLLGDRKAFIRQLRETYKTSIYNANEFFGVLFDLLNPELQLTACDWLRGDDLDEEDLRLIRVKNSIDSEDAAQKILENFGRIATETQPIVLCFDNLDGIPRTPEGFIDLQALFNVNSTIHNEKLQGFLLLISVITNTWIENSKRIQPADKARIDTTVSLRPINLTQAEGLLQVRLAHLYAKASPPPPPIYPFSKEGIEQSFPGGKTKPRNVLELGRRLFIEYKAGNQTISDPYAIFKLVWLKELQKSEQKIARIRQLASPELVQMLREALVALGAEDVRSRFLPSPSYFIYSFSFQIAGKGDRTGVVWTEEPNSTSFYHIMKACQKALEVELCQNLVFIRAEKLPRNSTKGYQLFAEIFKRGTHTFLLPSLETVHQLLTFYNLLNSARSKDLVIAGKTPTPEEYFALVRESQILQECELLQALLNPAKVVKKKRIISTKNAKQAALPEIDFAEVNEFLFNFVKINAFLGLQTLIQNTLEQFPHIDRADVEKQIHELVEQKKIQFIDPNAPPEAQLVCLVPQAK